MSPTRSSASRNCLVRLLGFRGVPTELGNTRPDSCHTDPKRRRSPAWARWSCRRTATSESRNAIGRCVRCVFVFFLDTRPLSCHSLNGVLDARHARVKIHLRPPKRTGSDSPSALVLAWANRTPTSRATISIALCQAGGAHADGAARGQEVSDPASLYPHIDMRGNVTPGHASQRRAVDPRGRPRFSHFDDVHQLAELITDVRPHHQWNSYQIRNVTPYSVRSCTPANNYI